MFRGCCDIASFLQVFREAIEIRTNLSDPSSDGVLKVGIYDSRDMAPDWLYVNEGAMFIAQLELIIWTVYPSRVQGSSKQQVP